MSLDYAIGDYLNKKQSDYYQRQNVGIAEFLARAGIAEIPSRVNQNCMGIYGAYQSASEQIVRDFLRAAGSHIWQMHFGWSSIDKPTDIGYKTLANVQQGGTYTVGLPYTPVAAVTVTDSDRTTVYTEGADYDYNTSKDWITIKSGGDISSGATIRVYRAIKVTVLDEYLDFNLPHTARPLRVGTTTVESEHGGATYTEGTHYELDYDTGNIYVYSGQGIAQDDKLVYQGRWGAYDWSKYDTCLPQLLAKGHALILMIGYPLSWVQPRNNKLLCQIVECDENDDPIVTNGQYNYIGFPDGHGSRTLLGPNDENTSFEVSDTKLAQLRQFCSYAFRRYTGNIIWMWEEEMDGWYDLHTVDADGKVVFDGTFGGHGAEFAKVVHAMRQEWNEVYDNYAQKPEFGGVYVPNVAYEKDTVTEPGRFLYHGWDGSSTPSWWWDLNWLADFADGYQYEGDPSATSGFDSTKGAHGWGYNFYHGFAANWGGGTEACAKKGETYIRDQTIPVSYRDLPLVINVGRPVWSNYGSDDWRKTSAEIMVEYFGHLWRYKLDSSKNLNWKMATWFIFENLYPDGERQWGLFDPNGHPITEIVFDGTATPDTGEYVLDRFWQVMRAFRKEPSTYRLVNSSTIYYRGRTSGWRFDLADGGHIYLAYGGGYSHLVETTPILAHFKFDRETVGDYESEFGGWTFTNVSSKVDPKAGKFGKAAEFVRSNSEVLRATDAEMFRFGAHSFTISVWVKLTSKPGNGGIIARWDPSNTIYQEWRLGYFSTQDRFGFGILDTQQASQTVFANNLGSPNTGQWYHILAWYDHANLKINIQIDGGEIDSQSLAYAVDPGTVQVTTGNLGYAATWFLDGLVDELVLIEKVLTVDERARLLHGERFWE